MTDRIILHKKGHTPLVIRQYRKETGVIGYEMLAYTDHYGGERWEKMPHSLDVIEDNISKYSTRYWQHEDTGCVCEAINRPSERWYEIDKIII